MIDPKALTPIGGAALGQVPAGSINVDIAAGDDGHHLYTLNAETGAVGIFTVQSDGSLISLGQQKGLPASGGINGIALY